MSNEPSASKGFKADNDSNEQTQHSKSSNGGAVKENVTGKEPKIERKSVIGKSPEMGDSSNCRTSLGKRKASEEGKEEEKGEGPAQEKCRKWQETMKDDEVTKKVYIWDLDETLIIFQSLLSGWSNRFVWFSFRCSKCKLANQAFFICALNLLIYGFSFGGLKYNLF